MSVNSCNIPTPRTPPKFTRYKGKKFDLVFDGDCHADRWEVPEGGKELWKRYFDGRAANFAFPGDRIQNILWRLKLGQMDGSEPRLIILMAGGSNTPQHSIEEISEGIQFLATEYQRCCPNAKMILMGIPPRGETITDKRRIKVIEINQKTADWCAGHSMDFLDLTPRMLLPDGTLMKGMHSDGIHMLTPAYQIWFDILRPVLEEIHGKTWVQLGGKAPVDEGQKTSPAVVKTSPLATRYQDSPFVLLRDVRLIRDFEGIPKFEKNAVAKGREHTASPYYREALSATKVFDVAIRDKLFRHYFHFIETFLILFSAQRECFGNARLEKIYFGEFLWNNSAQASVQRKLLSIIYPNAEIIDRLVPEMPFEGDLLYVDRNLTKTRVNKMIEPSLGLIEKWFPDLRNTVYRALSIEKKEGKDISKSQHPKILYVRRPPSRTLTSAVEESLLHLLSSWGKTYTVEFETLSWEEQVRLVADYDILIGVHGNNLTNLLWLPPHAMVVELLPPGARAYDYQMLAEVAGIQYFGIDEGVVFQSHDRSFSPVGVFSKGIDRLPEEGIRFAFNQYLKPSNNVPTVVEPIVQQAADQNPKVDQTQIIEADFHIVDAGIKSHLIDALKIAFDGAKRCEGKLSPGVLAMEGFSGKKYRYLINTLISKVKNPRYLEIGTYLGSTFCAAIQGNSATALAIDNWSGYGGPIQGFMNNLASACSKETKISLLSEDFRKISYSHIGSFNIFFFDGPHDYKDHLAALPLAWEALDQEFIYIVDDWNWDFVRNGTLDSFRSLDMDILYQLEIRTSSSNKQPKGGKDSFWHNGYVITVIRKKCTTLNLRS